MPHFRTWSHYPDTEFTSPCHILVMSNVRLFCDKYKSYKTYRLDSTGFELLIFRVGSRPLCLSPYSTTLKLFISSRVKAPTLYTTHGDIGLNYLPGHLLRVQLFIYYFHSLFKLPSITGHLNHTSISVGF